MSASPGGSFATVLLCVPLAALPLMAIFGIPEVGSLSADTQAEGPRLIRRPVDGLPGEFPLSESADVHRHTRAPDVSGGPIDDLFTSPEPIVGTAAAVANPAPSSDRGMRADGHRPRPMQTAALLTDPPPATATGASTSSPLASQSSALGLTWQTAARKLEEMGIENYRLERGQRSHEFLFVCVFSPGSDSRIVRRFEAESAEPLEAVAKVIQQIDDWLLHRYITPRGDATR